MKIIRRAGERRSPKLTAETDGRYHRSSLGVLQAESRRAGSMQAGGARKARWRYWRGGSEEDRGPELGGHGSAVVMDGATGEGEGG